MSGQCNRSRGAAFGPSLARHPMARRFANMKQRCYNPNDPSFLDYGARGIYICDEWLSSPLAFIKWCICNGYAPNLQLDRIDNDGPYSPDNCRFVTQLDNLKNRRPRAKNRGPSVESLLAGSGSALNLGTVRKRIRSGVPVADAIAKPLFDHVTHRCSDGRPGIEVARHNGVGRAAYRSRILRGWSVDDAATIPPGQKRKVSP